MNLTGSDNGKDLKVGDIVWLKGEVDELPTSPGDVKVRFFARPGFDEYAKQQYSNEMLTEQSHVELLEVLLQHHGQVVISGYESSLYKEMLEDRG
jgi:hypothetical protein